MQIGMNKNLIALETPQVSYVEADILPTYYEYGLIYIKIFTIT
jgi:hypothetical protein